MKPAMRSVILSVALLGSGLLFGQDTLITMEVPRDTIGVGQKFRVVWTVHARTDTISAPTFEAPWKIDFGPMKGTSMQMKNGSITNSVSLTYELHATQTGAATLPVIQARVEEKWHSSRPVPITVTAEPVPDREMNPKTMVPVTGYQPILVMINGKAGLISAHDPKHKSGGHDLTSDEAASLIESFQEVLRTSTDPLTGITSITATLGKTGGSVGIDTEGGRRSFELTSKQAQKLEAEVQKILNSN